MLSDALNRNLLAIFLASNLLTGAANLARQSLSRRLLASFLPLAPRPCPDLPPTSMCARRPHLLDLPCLYAARLPA